MIHGVAGLIRNGILLSVMIHTSTILEMDWFMDWLEMLEVQLPAMIVLICPVYLSLIVIHILMNHQKFWDYLQKKNVIDYYIALVVMYTDYV